MFITLWITFFSVHAFHSFSEKRSSSQDFHRILNGKDSVYSQCFLTDTAAAEAISRLQIRRNYRSRSFLRMASTAAFVPGLFFRSFSTLSQAYRTVE